MTHFLTNYTLRDKSDYLPYIKMRQLNKESKNSA